MKLIFVITALVLFNNTIGDSIMTTTTIIRDMTMAVNLDGFTRLQMKHMLLALVAKMTTDEAVALLATLDMTPDDLDL